MPSTEADFEIVRRLMRSAVSGRKGGAKPPLAAGDWKWVLHGQLLRARLLGRLSAARRIPRERWTRIAAAIELVHAASLLHDDVIDGARLRRHAPALWTVYGARAAILAGDYLLATAFDLLSPAEPAMRPALTRLLGAALVTCTAEMEIELAPQSGHGAPKPTEEDLLVLARDKTGPLFAVAAIATLPAGTASGRIAFWQNIGSEIGLIYQIADDLSDATATAAATGKTPGTDAARLLPTTASFATAGMLSNRCNALLARIATAHQASAGEKAACAAYLGKDLFPALRPLEQIKK